MQFKLEEKVIEIVLPKKMKFEPGPKLKWNDLKIRHKNLILSVCDCIKSIGSIKLMMISNH